MRTRPQFEISFRNCNLNSAIEKPAALSPSRRVFRCRLLTLLLGRPKLFHQIDVGSPPALSPSLAGSQRIGGREAADPLTSDDFNLSSTLKALGSEVDQLCGFSIPTAAASTGVVSNASISTGSRSPANAVSHLVAVTISTPLQRAPPLRKSIAMAGPESSLATTVPMIVLDYLASEPSLLVRFTEEKSCCEFLRSPGVDDKRI